MNSTTSKPSPAALHVSSAGGVGWLVLDNPDKYNAISLSMWRSLIEALQQFEADPAVRCVVIRGQGDRAFCAGADIAEKQGAGADEAAEGMQQALAGLRTLDAFSKPVIAMISGHCLGAGLAIALACDMRFAAAGASFGIPAAKLGLAYNYSEIKRLTDVVGPSLAKQIVFTADRITAEHALQMRLVNGLVPADQLLLTVEGMARRIAANAPLTIAAAKQAVALVVSDPAGVDTSACDQQARACLASEDHAEGLRAFREKRTPIFRGQ